MREDTTARQLRREQELSSNHNNMKYPRLANWYAPNAVHDWLQNELENHGIDSSVYTRYVLSMLSDDEDSDDSAGSYRTTGTKNSSIGHSMKQRNKCIKQPNSKWLHKRYQSGQGENVCQKWCDCASCNESKDSTSEERKLAVVACLESASEQTFDIKSLVDELEARLKQVKCQAYNASAKNNNNKLVTNNSSAERNHQQKQHPTQSKSSPQAVAKLYFDAFPALEFMSSAHSTILKQAASTSYYVKQKNSSDKIKKWNGQRIIETVSEATKQTILSELENEACKSSAQCGDHSAAFASMLAMGIAATSNNPFAGLSPYSAQVRNALKNADQQYKSFCLADDENLQNLASKFNSTVASIWNEKLEQAEQEPVEALASNIWGFDESKALSSSNCGLQTRKIWQINGHAPNDIFDSSSLKPFMICDDDFGYGPGMQEAITTCVPPSSILDAANNRTSLANHDGANSLFTKVSPKPKQYQTTEYAAGTDRHLLFGNGDCVDNLLTTAQTHFQPIRQDYYEKEAGMVIDPNVTGMVPCSPKCPNKSRKKPTIAEQPTAENSLALRPSSVSLPELSSFIGPFPEPQPQDSEPKGHSPTELGLPMSTIIETFGRNTNFSDKSTSTEEGTEEREHQDCTPTGPVDSWEKKVMLTTGDQESSVKDYETLCCLLDEILQKQQQDEVLEQSEYSDNLVTRIGSIGSFMEEQSPGALRVASDFEANQLVLDMEEEMRREEAEIFADIFNKTAEVNDELALERKQEGDEFNDAGVFYDDSQWVDYASFDDGNDTKDSEWSTGCRGYEQFSTSKEQLHKDEKYDLDSQLHDESDWQPNAEVNSNGVQFDYKSRNDHSYSQKPCSFFLEGNCRRTDCKFSHDLRRITCKFWEEGSCFKGDLCPFLHGYDSEINHHEEERFYQHAPLKKKPSFTIESEQDFPSLAGNDDFPELGSTPEQNSATSVKGKREKQILTRMVGKKRKKGNHQRCNEKAV